MTEPKYTREDPAAEIAELRSIVAELVEVLGKNSFYLRKTCSREGRPVGNEPCGCGNCVVAGMNDDAIAKARRVLR